MNGISYQIQIPKENEIQITMTASAYGQVQPMCVEGAEFDASGYEVDIESVMDKADAASLNIGTHSVAASPLNSFSASASGVASGVASAIRKNLKHFTRNSWTSTSKELFESQLSFEDESPYPIGTQDVNDTPVVKEAATRSSDVSSSFRRTSQSARGDIAHSSSLRHADGVSQNGPILLTPLSHLPNSNGNERFIGRVSLHFVKENNIVFETGNGLFGMGGFTHSLVCELYAILRAHTTALGGNGMVGVSIDQIVCSDSNIKVFFC